MTSPDRERRERDDARDGPTFAVVVPAFNSAGTLADALESTLRQTRPPLEVIVVDDGSHDETAEVAAGFGPPVRVVQQANAGTAAARNRGIREATADVVAFLDSDDLYDPERLEHIAARLVAEPELAAVLTDCVMVSPEQTMRVSSWWPSDASRDRLDVRVQPVFCAISIRRNVLERLGGFDTRYRLLEDVDLWYRLVCGGHAVGYVDEPSYVYRLNPDGKTQGRQSGAGERELFSIHLRYALGLRTPHRFRPRLAARAFRHGRAWGLAALRGA